MSGAATQVPPFLHGGLQTGVEHVAPVQKDVHEQVSGATQVPEFWQVLLQTARVKRMRSYGFDEDV